MSLRAARPPSRATLGIRIDGRPFAHERDAVGPRLESARTPPRPTRRASPCAHRTPARRGRRGPRAAPLRGARPRALAGTRARAARCSPLPAPATSAELTAAVERDERRRLGSPYDLAASGPACRCHARRPRSDRTSAARSAGIHRPVERAPRKARPARLSLALGARRHRRATLGPAPPPRWRRRQACDAPSPSASSPGTISSSATARIDLALRDRARARRAPWPPPRTPFGASRPFQ